MSNKRCFLHRVVQTHDSTELHQLIPFRSSEVPHQPDHIDVFSFLAFLLLYSPLEAVRTQNYHDFSCKRDVCLYNISGFFSKEKAEFSFQ